MVQDRFKTAPRCPKMASSRPRWTRTGPIRFQERPKIGDMGQDGSQINPTRSQNYFPLLFCSYLFFFPSLFFSFGEPFPLEKKALVKYPPCIAIVRFSLLYSNYQTLSYCSICQTSLPLYYLPYTSPCITLVTSFPCSTCLLFIQTHIFLFLFLFLCFPFLSFRMGGAPKSYIELGLSI